MAIAFPTAPTEGESYSFGGSEYVYESLNNRWLAQAAGGASVTVSQDRPDPATAGQGDLWWYCGDGPGGVEDPGLFTLVIDTTGNQQWVQSSPSALLAGSTGGGGSEFVSFDPRAVATSTNTLTAEGTLTAGENGAYGWFTASTLDRMTVTVTGDGSIMMPGGSTNYNVDRQNAGLPRGFTTSFTITADSANSRDFVGGMFYLGPNGTITGGNFNGAQFEARMVDIVPVSAGGSSTTVNIGGGAGLQLGVTAKDTITTSTTITADDLTGTGPAWVLLGGGGGSGAVAQYNRVNSPSGSAGAGGAGGNYGFFINDSASLVGATFTAGASGTAQSNVGVNVGDGTTVIFGSDGTAGTTSTLVLDGTTYTCTGGGGGVRGNPGTAGAAGTATATGGTPLDLIDVQTINTDIDTYWDGFIVVDATGDLRLGGNVPDAALTGSGGGAGDAAFAVPQGRDGEGPVRAVNSGSGSAGSLQIVYQNQA